MGTENKKKKKEKKRTHPCVRREIMLVGLYWEHNSTAETILLFYLKFIQAKIWAWLNSFISGFAPPVNICCYLKSMGVTKEWKLQLLAIA